MVVGEGDSKACGTRHFILDVSGRDLPIAVSSDMGAKGPYRPHTCLSRPEFAKPLL